MLLAMLVDRPELLEVCVCLLEVVTEDLLELDRAIAIAVRRGRPRRRNARAASLARVSTSLGKRSRGLARGRIESGRPNRRSGLEMNEVLAGERAEQRIDPLRNLVRDELPEGVLGEHEAGD